MEKWIIFYNMEHSLLHNTLYNTLFKPGSVQYLVEETERYGLRVVVLQEIRWNDKETLYVQYITIFYGECNKHRQFGTGSTLTLSTFNKIIQKH